MTGLVRLVIMLWFPITTTAAAVITTILGLLLAILTGRQWICH